MADSLVEAEGDPAITRQALQDVNMPSDDDQDVHYCGRCKLSFTDLSEYIKHKANRLCREILNKSTLSDVVEKLPIDGNQSKGQSKKKSGDATESATTNSSQRTQADTETTDESPSARRVEVQFLEPLVAGESEDVPSSVGKDRTGHKTVDGAKTGKPSKRHKRKNSHPKTTRKRKSSSSTQAANQEKGKEPRSKKSSTSTDEAVTVHIPESQLVHLTSGSAAATPSSTHQGSGVRKQGATSVFVPIYLNPPSKVYKCQRCPAVFSAVSEKEEHYKMHKKEFKCSLCSKSFFTANGFEQHKANESHAHPCDDCGKVFTSTVQLKKHKTMHSTERPFACDQCDKSFCSSANLRSHARTVHATEKKHKCPECGKAFARRDKMKRHSLIHYPDTRPTFTCPFRSHTGCMKTFYRDDKLKRHLFTHSKDKPFKCEKCNKGYARRDNLNDHMRIHTGNYSHTCRLCDKGFLGPHKLKKHMRSAHRISLSPDSMDNHPPTMVPLTSSTAPGTTISERAMSAVSGGALQSPQDDGDAVPSSPEEASDVGDEEAFDGSGSESADEATSEEEGTIDEGESETPEPVQRQAPPRTPASTLATPNPAPFTPASHGPLPRMRPVPRVSAAPQQFIPPPLPPGLQATAELMAFTQELFNVVGRYQS